MLANEVLSFIEENDVKFIRLAFTDLFGRLRNIAILPDQLAPALESGVAIDAPPFPDARPPRAAACCCVPIRIRCAFCPGGPSPGGYAGCYATWLRRRAIPFSWTAARFLGRLHAMRRKRVWKSASAPTANFIC